MPKHTLYFSDDMLAKLELDKSGAEGLSARVSRLCNIAVELLHDAVPALAKKEWCALADIANGEHIAAPQSVQDQVRQFTFSIMESGLECDAKWDVNCIALATKFKALPLASQLAVMEICRRFWVKSDIHSRFVDYGEIMAAHGAIFETPTKVRQGLIDTAREVPPNSK